MNELKAKQKTWIEQLQSGKYETRLIRVLNYIKQKSLASQYAVDTDIRSIGKNLNVVHQSLTATLSNLQDVGLIKVIGQIECDGSHLSVFCFVQNEDERNCLMWERYNEKFNNWLKQGVTLFREQLPSKLLFELASLKIEQ